MITLSLLLLPAVFAVQGCKSKEERAAVLAQQADAYAQAGNLVAARQAIGQAIALREDQSSYHELQGAIALRSNDTLGAYRSFQRALEFDAINKTALAYVANIGVQVGQLDDAEAAADKLLTLEPNAAAALQVKGMIALSRKKYDTAIELADRILAANPTDEAAAIIKARSFARTGKADESIALIDAAMGVSKESPALLTNKLNIYRFLGKPQEMAPLLDAVVRMSKGNPVYRLDQINLLYKLGQTDQARAASIALLAAGSPDPGHYRTLQRLWWQYDKTPVSEAAARGVSNWKEPLAVVMVVRHLFMSGDLKTADTVLRNAPANAQPLVASLKARLFAASGRRDEARKQAEALLAKDDHDIDALLLRAQFAKAAGQIDVAVEAGQLATTNDPLNPETFVVLAEVYRAQKADWRARQVFEDGLRSLPQNFYLLEKYTQYLHQLGDKGRAMSVTKAFARAVPSATRAWELLGAECQWAGDQLCLQNAYRGFLLAKSSYIVDDMPGTPPDRGLFGRI